MTGDARDAPRLGGAGGVLVPVELQHGDARADGRAERLVVGVDRDAHGGRPLGERPGDGPGLLGVHATGGPREEDEPRPGGPLPGGEGGVSGLAQSADLGRDAHPSSSSMAASAAAGFGAPVTARPITR